MAVNSDPWSNVEVDGVEAGSTPLTIELAPGPHRFRAAMADGRVVEKEFEVTADRNRVVAALGQRRRTPRSRATPSANAGSGTSSEITANGPPSKS